MHIPENYLSPMTCAAMGAVMLPIWYKAVKEVKVKVNTDKKTIPMLGIGTSLSFLIMMFNLPAPGGTSAHAVGAVLIAILLGPCRLCYLVMVGFWPLVRMPFVWLLSCHLWVMLFINS